MVIPTVFLAEETRFFHDLIDAAVSLHILAGSFESKHIMITHKSRTAICAHNGAVLDRQRIGQWPAELRDRFSGERRYPFG